MSSRVEKETRGGSKTRQSRENLERERRRAPHRRRLRLSVQRKQPLLLHQGNKLIRDQHTNTPRMSVLDSSGEQLAKPLCRSTTLRVSCSRLVEHGHLGLVEHFCQGTVIERRPVRQREASPTKISRTDTLAQVGCAEGEGKRSVSSVRRLRASSDGQLSFSHRPTSSDSSP